MDLNLNSSNIKQYNILNHDIEICGNYFDVVPDGNLFTLDDLPIFAVRMRPMGILHIMNSYNKKYNINTKVLTYKLNSNQYTLYSSDSREMYKTQKDAILKFFDFSQCKNNEFKGIIIVITNKDDRMIHAIPYIYGIIDNKKKIIFLDPYFELNIFSGCVIGADFFYQNINGIECYCHGETIQADHHSCGIIACDFVKNCLKSNAKLAKKILDSVIMRVEVKSLHNNSTSYVNSFDLPVELKKFSQIHVKKQYENVGKWNKDLSRSEKEGRCGIVETGNGYELCWGIGESGQRTYITSYTITGLVRGYPDADALRHVFLVHFARLPLDLFLLGLGALAVLFLQRLCLVVSVDDALDHVLHENTSIL